MVYLISIKSRIRFLAVDPATLLYYLQCRLESSANFWICRHFLGCEGVVLRRVDAADDKRLGYLIIRLGRNGQEL